MLARSTGREKDPSEVAKSDFLLTVRQIIEGLAYELLRGVK